MKPKIVHIPLPNLYNPEKKNEYIEEPDMIPKISLWLTYVYFIIGICIFICGLFSDPKLQIFLLMGGGIGILMGIFGFIFYKMID